MKKIYFGQDNGVTSTYAILGDDFEPIFAKTPVKSVQDYTKCKKNITRLDGNAYYKLLKSYIEKGYSIQAILERPMTNPTMARASESALRCFEAMWTIIDLLNIPVQFIPSGDWQKELLPHGTKGAPELKKASLDIGNRLFPQFKEFKHPDRDGLLIAYWAKKNKL